MWSLCAVLLLALDLSALGALIPDARPITLPVELKGTQASVKTPSGCVSCVVESRRKGTQNWFRWKTILPVGKPTLTSFAVPQSMTNVEWRATATVSAAKAAAFAKTHKFPDAFYQGSSRFSRTPAGGYQAGYSAQVLGNSGVGGINATGNITTRLVSSPPVSSVATSQISGLAPTNDTSATKTSTDTGPAQLQEADIWKASGSTVYFFNQLRGLQVIDLTDASHPKMTTSLRLPAVGQDLYVLPETDDAGNIAPSTRVVLLTRDFQDTGAKTTVLVVSVTGSDARVVSRTVLNGWLSDSRVLGNRLYVLTNQWSEAAGTSLQEIQIALDGTQTSGALIPIPNSNAGGLISAGPNWLTVAANSWDDWTRSNLTLFGFSAKGIECLTPNAIACAGRIYDKFKVSREGDRLTVVSQRYETSTSGPFWMDPVTLVENFDPQGAPLCKPLEVVRGEQLYASRFLPGKLYLVTAVQSDPLWVVDLSDPASPTVAGHVEVPGFSTHIEPVGNDGRFLFTMGMESGKVAASLFDVSEVQSPVLKSRVYVNDSTPGYSEALYDDKALKVLADDGLVLVPFSGYAWNNTASEKSSFIRLLDLNLTNGGSLTVRGRLDHAFSPRRATLIDGALASISQKELITADVSDRDHPAMLAEVGLAWPVNQVLNSSGYLLQIGDGSNAGWTGETAALRITSTETPDLPIADIDLGEGTVQDAALKAGRLYVLRKKWGAPDEPMPYLLTGASIVARKAAASELVLDIYDASALPALPLMGSVSSKVDGKTVTSKHGGLVWISDTLVGVVSQPYVWSFGWEPRIVNTPVVISALRTSLTASTGAPAVAASLIAPGYPIDCLPMPRYERPQPAVVRAFDVSNPLAPTALAPYTLAGSQSTMLTTIAAGDGLLAYGYGESPVTWRHAKWPENREQPVTCSHKLAVVDFAAPGKPTPLATTILPGRLFAVSEVSRTGMLAFTESVSASSLGDTPTREVQVNAIDGSQSTLVSGTKVGLQATCAAEGRALYIADESGAQRLLLTDAGTWQESVKAAIPFIPQDVAIRGASLLGVSGDQIERVSWSASASSVETWPARIWVPAARLIQGADRNLYAPQGDYGVQSYSAQ